MHRNKFGEPHPLGVDEIDAAMSEAELDASAVIYADIAEDRESPAPFAGWFAEITGTKLSGEDIGDPIITLGYPTKDALLADLHSVGIRDITIF